MKTNLETIPAIVVSTLLMSLLAFVPTVAAKVIHTTANVTISSNGSINIDLNHDGITDFVLTSTSQRTICGNRGGLIGSTKITPMAGNGVVVSHLNFAAVLASGIPIGAGSAFYKAQAVVTQFFICTSGTHSTVGYLGLEFQINGQRHYGWAQVNIDAFYSNFRQGMHTTLVDFAYETIPGLAIKTGQISGSINDVGSVPQSTHPIDSAISSPLGPQENKPKHSHYKVIDLGTFGGPSSSYNFGSVIINGRGAVVSAADTSIFDVACGCFVAHGFRWENGVLTDLGTLPGGDRQYC